MPFVAPWVVSSIAIEGTAGATDTIEAGAGAETVDAVGGKTGGAGTVVAGAADANAICGTMDIDPRAGKTGAASAAGNGICGTKDRYAIGDKSVATDTIVAVAHEANLLYLGSPNSLRDTERRSFSTISFHLLFLRLFHPVIVSSTFNLATIRITVL